MNLEEEIDVIIQLCISKHWTLAIASPYFQDLPQHLSNNNLPSSTFHTMWKQVDEVIKNASPELCLTSPSHYIRECKKWYLDNES